MDKSMMDKLWRRDKEVRSLSYAMDPGDDDCVSVAVIPEPFPIARAVAADRLGRPGHPAGWML